MTLILGGDGTDLLLRKVVNRNAIARRHTVDTGRPIRSRPKGKLDSRLRGNSRISQFFSFSATTSLNLV
jgi:hypothetical protein